MKLVVRGPAGDDLLNVLLIVDKCMINDKCIINECKINV